MSALADAPTRRSLRDAGSGAGAPRVPRPRAGGSGRLPHIAVAFVLLSAAAIVLVGEHALRVAEAQVASFIARSTFATEAVFATSALQPSIGFTMGDRWMVARITGACAIAFYLAPILALGGLFALNTRVRLGRVLLAAVVGVVGMALLNQVRLAAICFAWGTWGKAGFHWVHGPLGTALMLVGLAATFLTFFLIVVRRRMRN
jgi:exosortase/archaeosortase family protein